MYGNISSWSENLVPLIMLLCLQKLSVLRKFPKFKCREIYTLQNREIEFLIREIKFLIPSVASKLRTTAFCGLRWKK